MAEVLGLLVFFGLVIAVSKGVEFYINNGKPNKVKYAIKELITEED